MSFFSSINPSTGEGVCQYPQMSPAQVEEMILDLHQSFSKWRDEPLQTRLSKMHSLIQVLLTKKEECARLMAQEMGKPIAQGRLEIEKCVKGIQFYIEHAEKFLTSEIIRTEAFKTEVCFEPFPSGRFFDLPFPPLSLEMSSFSNMPPTSADVRF